MWPFLYVAGERLSESELRAARLDGHVVELGEAFVAADAIETRELRAASLSPVTGNGRALTHASAAWVHGAIPSPPPLHSVQRSVARRVGPPHGVRGRYRDLRLPACDVQRLGGVDVTTPVRTLVDCVREVVAEGASPAVVDALLTWRPALRPEALGWLDASGPVHHKRAAAASLRASQDDVTR